MLATVLSLRNYAYEESVIGLCFRRLRMLGMLVRSFRCTAISTAVIFVSLAVVPAYAGLEGPIEDAARLLQEGEVIRAKNTLYRLQRDATTTEDRERILELLSATENRLNFMSPVEISLQKASMALEFGDLRTAQMQANAALRSDRASIEMRQQASDVLDAIAAKRVDLEPLAGPMLMQAITDFKAQDYANAKAGFLAVKRMDVRLNQTDRASLNRYQQRIYDLEREQEAPFDAEVISFGVLQQAALAVATDLPVGFQPEESEPVADEPEMDEMPEMAASEERNSDSLFQDLAKIEAERVMNEADLAFAAGKYAEAVEHYQRVVTTLAAQLADDELAYAKDRLADANAFLGGSDVNLLEQEVKRRSILREEALTEKDNFVRRANDAIGRGDTGDARNLFAQARLTASNANNNGLLAESEFRAISRDLDALARTIENTEEGIRIAEINQQAEVVQREASQSRLREERERDEKVAESLIRLRALQNELKYEEALQVIDQVLFLDPNNPAGLLMKDVLQDLIFYRQWEETERARNVSYAREAIERNKILSIPDSIMEFPPDWPELSWRRGSISDFLETEADRRVLATLESTRIPGQFDGNELGDVLQFIATVTNLNLDVDWDSLSLLGIEEDTEVDLNLREVPARVVLDRVLQKVSPDEFSLASWAVNDGILIDRKSVV